MKKIMVPPIKCQGIKTKFVKTILQYTNHICYSKWIEPFTGSGVVGFNVASKKGLFNDINPHIIAFYNALKSQTILPENVKSFLCYEGSQLEKEGQKYYYFVRDRFNKEANPLDFLFLSRSCFNGMIRFNQKGLFNVPFCRKNKRFSKSYISKIVNQVETVYNLLMLNDWHFENNDFRKIIENASPNDLIYCDPPYFGRHVDYFNSWTDEDEYDLYKSLKNTKAKFILSTWYKNEFRENTSIKNYWNHFKIITHEHFYHIGGKEENRNPMTEALVFNFVPEEPTKRKTKYENWYQGDLLLVNYV